MRISIIQSSPASLADFTTPNPMYTATHTHHQNRYQLQRIEFYSNVYISQRLRAPPCFCLYKHHHITHTATHTHTIHCDAVCACEKCQFHKSRRLQPTIRKTSATFMLAAEYRIQCQCLFKRTHFSHTHVARCEFRTASFGFCYIRFYGWSDRYTLESV